MFDNISIENSCGQSPKGSPRPEARSGGLPLRPRARKRARVAYVARERIEVDTGSSDYEGRLIFCDGRLAGVLVRLEGKEHGHLRGQWHIEAMFDAGPAVPDTFKSLEEVDRFLRRRIG